MAGFRNFVIGCVLSAASIMMPMVPAQAVPLAAAGVKIDRPADIQSVDYRRRYPEYRGGYRPYRPYYGYRPYRPYYGYRPYYRPYYRPGVNVYIAPRPIYRDRYIRRSYGNSHVNWCLSRYRSYNPASNRFLSYGGVYKVCYSPYR